MNSTIGGYGEAVGELEHAVARVLAEDPARLGPAELTDALGRIETVARRLSAVQVAVAAAANAAGVPGRCGYANLKVLLQRRYRLTGGEAAARVRGVQNRAARQQLSGAVSEPRYPLLAEHQRAGAVSEGQLAEIEKVLSKAARAGADAEVLSLMESILADAALDEQPHALWAAGRYAMSLLDAQGEEPDDRRARAQRGIDLGPQNADDLTSEIGGVVTAPVRAMLDAVFAKWARPGINNPADGDDRLLGEGGDAAAMAAAAERDDRSASQRRHDALCTALASVLDAGLTGAHRGLPAVPIVTMTLEQVEAEVGVATTATGGSVSVADAVEILRTHPYYVLLLDAHSRPLWLGRSRRLATADQRLALVGAERGCTAPGCDSAPAYCEVHHRDEWAGGGATDIDNLTLACSGDHHSVGPPGAEAGWETIAAPPGSRYAGRTVWRRGDGPARVNHAHHPDELYEEALRRWRERRDEALARLRAARIGEAS
ncbi:DUF222 domain-containing protein [Tsukamurella asaccharolytica]|uniref:DUF222 domain-containing protein n=1 Tax=Tsukamurella asaccharolytica TaxID=2592067 RepID=A0A5C5R6Z0_9ACTN|nr:HNH endonuclease signature motif containing protein [Tsukamurella asaccharolytica]TWS18154.1 DUF222 domain-containing protein [Tsukamurella asaccharolytica]